MTITPEIDEFLEGAETPHRHQGRGSLARAPARQPGLHRRQAFRSRRQPCRRVRILRPVHFDRLHPLRARHSLPAAQGRRRHQPRRVRSIEPFRQGAGQRAGELSARRAVSDRRGHALRIRARHSAARRAAARARAAAARPLRPIRFGARLRAARPLRQQDPGEIGDYLAAAFKGEVRAFDPFFPEGPLVRVHFIIGRDEGETPRSRSRRRSSARSKRSCAPGSTASTRRSPPAHDRHAAARCWRAIAAAFPADYREAYSPAAAVADIGVIEDAHRRASARRRASTVGGAGTARAGLKVFSQSRPIPLSERVPVLENMGFRVVDERTYHIRAEGRAGCLAARHGAAKRVRPTVRSRRAQRAARSLLPRGHGRTRRERRLQRAGARGRAGVARRRADLRAHLALSAPDPRALFAGLHVGDAAQARRRRRADRRAVPHPLRSPSRRRRTSARRSEAADRRRDRNARCRRSRASTRTASCAISPTRSRPRCAPIFISGPRRQTERPDRHQVRQPQARRHAVAAAALRDLRLFAAGRGRASALRQGGARRHPLVGPAAGFPHRDPGPGQGAAGQERGHRAGRRQGRLRAQAAAGRRHARGHPGRRHRAPTQLFIDACSTSPTISAPAPRRRAAAPTSCATTATIPIWWSPPTRAPRLSPTSPTTSPRRTASGWATRSPPAARPATTTRRWASPRAAPGKRSSAISARWTSTSRRAVHRRRRRRHVGRRVRQRHAARKDHQAGRRLRSSPHLHRSRSRCRNEASPSASACSICRARAGRTSTNRSSPRAAASSRAAPKRSRFRREAQTLLGVGAKAHAGRADPRHAQGAGRPALLRRHRHLRARRRRNR